MTEQTLIHGVSADLLKKWHRDLDACQKAIWLSGCRPRVPSGFDPAYVEDAQHSLKEIELAISIAGKVPEPVAWDYRNTYMGDHLSYHRRDHYHRPQYSAHEHDYVKGAPLYGAPVIAQTIVGDEQVGVVLSEAEMGIGFDRKYGPVLWFGQRRQPGPLYQRQFDPTEVLGLLELMAGVCEKAQLLIDSTNTLHAEHAENLLNNALDACNEVPPIDDANERDGWHTVYDRIRNILK